METFWCPFKLLHLFYLERELEILNEDESRHDFSCINKKTHGDSDSVDKKIRQVSEAVYVNHGVVSSLSSPFSIRFKIEKKWNCFLISQSELKINQLGLCLPLFFGKEPCMSFMRKYLILKPSALLCFVESIKTGENVYKRHLN